MNIVGIDNCVSLNSKKEKAYNWKVVLVSVSLCCRLFCQLCLTLPSQWNGKSRAQSTMFYLFTFLCFCIPFITYLLSCLLSSLPLGSQPKVFTSSLFTAANLNLLQWADSWFMSHSITFFKGTPFLSFSTPSLNRDGVTGAISFLSFHTFHTLVSYLLEIFSFRYFL